VSKSWGGFLPKKWLQESIRVLKHQLDISPPNMALLVFNNLVRTITVGWDAALRALLTVWPAGKLGHHTLEPLNIPAAAQQTTTTNVIGANI
jgi:hypothetical protein